MDDLPKIGFGNGSFLANEDSDSGIQKDRIMFLGAKKELSSSYRPTVMKDNHEEDEPIRNGSYFLIKIFKFLQNCEHRKARSAHIVQHESSQKNFHRSRQMAASTTTVRPE